VTCPKPVQSIYAFRLYLRYIQFTAVFILYNGRMCCIITAEQNGSTTRNFYVIDSRYERHYLLMSATFFGAWREIEHSSPFTIGANATNSLIPLYLSTVLTLLLAYTRTSYSSFEMLKQNLK